MAKKRLSTNRQDLVSKILSNKLVHREKYHGPKKFAWEYLKKSDQKEFNRFDKEYFKSLDNKTVSQRVRYIINFLENHGFQSFKELSGGVCIEEVLGGEQEWDGSWNAGDKFYIVYQDNLVIACQLGKRKFKHGVNFGFAHIDSPYIKGIGGFQQKHGLTYMVGEPYGDFVPSSWFNVPLAMCFEGYSSKSGKCKPIEFIIGDKDKEPGFIISNESSHLDDKEALTRNQIKIIMGGMPYTGKVHPCKKTLFETLGKFYSEFGICENDFKKGQTTFFPACKQKRIGINSSLISGFGQDDLACAFPVLYSFANTRVPAYTCFLQLHPGEEIHDEGRASVTGNFISEVVLPAVAELRDESLGDHYHGLLSGISIWLDVAEAAHACSPELHDPYDSFYVNAGVAISRHSGDEDQDEGYVPSPRILTGFSRLFEQKNIPVQIGTMGYAEDRIPGSKAIHSPLFTEGMDFNVPMIGMHRGQGEITSPIDIWFVAQAMKAFYNMPNRKIFPEKHNIKAQPRRLRIK